MKETGLTGKRRSTTIAATPDDGKSQRKRLSYLSNRSHTLMIPLNGYLASSTNCDVSLTPLQDNLYLAN